MMMIMMMKNNNNLSPHKTTIQLTFLTKLIVAYPMTDIVAVHIFSARGRFSRGDD